MLMLTTRGLAIRFINIYFNIWEVDVCKNVKAGMAASSSICQTLYLVGTLTYFVYEIM